MSKNYPPVTVRNLDKVFYELREQVLAETSKKFKLSRFEVLSVIAETAGKLNHIMSPEYIGTIHHAAGLDCVDPKHFNALNNLRLYIFLDLLLDDESKLLCNYELALLLMEIKELRAVLQQRFKYNWTEHRRHFPLIAQSSI
ncbi:MAG: hypothetical protein PHV59_07605 [Victivallales bacterium]|nr:hypothetical protein [Victivallales bacterium]